MPPKKKFKKKSVRIKPIEDMRLTKVGAQCVISIALNKSWSTRPSYWVDLYLHVKRGVRFWDVIRKWRFPKDGEMVIGEAVAGYSHNSFPSAVMYLKEITLDKLEHAGYVANNIAIVKGLTDVHEDALLSKAFNSEPWNEVDVDEIRPDPNFEPGVNAVAIPPEPEQRPEPKKKPLDAAMEERKKKGFWT